MRISDWSSDVCSSDLRMLHAGVALAALSIGLSTEALAQDQDQVYPASTGAPQAEAGLGDILVVARRTQERLQDVPISITAISAEKIESAQLSQGSNLITLSTDERRDGEEWVSECKSRWSPTH